MANDTQTYDSAPSVSTSNRGRSKVWNNFVVSEDRKKVICRLCGDSLAYSTSQSTSSMLKHLTKKHNVESSYPSVEDDLYKNQGEGKTVGTQNKKKNRVERIFDTSETAERELPLPPLSPLPTPSVPVLFTEPCVKMRWTDHKDAFLGAFTKLFYDERYTDVTIVAENVFFKSHRVILSSASEFFDEMFQSTPDGQHPIIYLKNTKSMNLRILLDFIYKGEVTVPPSAIKDLVQIGIEMKVRGLCDFNWNEPEKDDANQTDYQGQNQSDSSQNLQPEYDDSEQQEVLGQTESFTTAQTLSFSNYFDTPEKMRIIASPSRMETESHLSRSARKRMHIRSLQSPANKVGMAQSNPTISSTLSQDDLPSASVSPVKRFRILTSNSASNKTRADNTRFSVFAHLDHQSILNCASEDLPGQTMMTLTMVDRGSVPGVGEDALQNHLPLAPKIEHMDHHANLLDGSHLESGNVSNDVVYSVGNLTGLNGEAVTLSSQHECQSNPQAIVMYDPGDAT